MADNTQLNKASSAGDIIASDAIVDVAGQTIKHQRVKMQYGDDGSATDVSATNRMPVADWFIEVGRGNVPGHSLVNKFGAATVDSTLTPLCESGTTGGIYRTPTTATALEFVSSSANDTAAGTGAREITVVGLDSNWNEVSQTVTTNGTTAVALGTNLIRLYRWFVSSSGSYASAAAGSHAGNLTVREAGAGATWSVIEASPFPSGQSEIGAYTIPIGYSAYLVFKSVHVNSAKSADVQFFARENANDVTAPYTGIMRVIQHEVGVSGAEATSFNYPRVKLTGPCDVGFLGSISSGTANITCEFTLLMVQDGY